MKQLSAIFSV